MLVDPDAENKYPAAEALHGVQKFRPVVHVAIPWPASWRCERGYVTAEVWRNTPRSDLP